MNQFTLKEIFKTSAANIYKAWLNSEEHSKMTGGEAFCSDQIGGQFTTWDDYISGKNVELIENKKIVQDWRTTEFSEDEKDSRIEIILTETVEGTELCLIHSNLEQDAVRYKNGWIEHYFKPMHKYFKS